LVFCLSASGPDTDALRASFVEDDPVHERVADDGEIGTIACRLEIPVVRRHSPACSAVHSVWGDPSAAGRVMVLRPEIAQVQRSGTEGAIEVAPLFDGCTVYRDWAAASMVRGFDFVEIEVILKSAKGREHLGP
jgi:hypothetical protein